MLTRKHFIKMAKQVANLEDRNLAKCWANGYIELGQNSNPNFDKERFLKACNL